VKIKFAYGLKALNGEVIGGNGEIAGCILNPGAGCQLHATADKLQADYPIIWPPDLFWTLLR
jgi:hypothetical protein